MKTEKLEEIQKNYSFEYINPKFALELWQEGESFARQVIQLYIESFSELITNCQKAIAKQDIEALEFIIHQTKPNLIQLEASYLFTLLQSLEKLLTNNFQELKEIHKFLVRLSRFLPKFK